MKIFIVLCAAFISHVVSKPLKSHPETTPKVIDITKQVAAIVQGYILHHVGGVHTILGVGDPEYGVSKRFILTYGVVKDFSCRDFEPVIVQVPPGNQLIVFSATYGSGRRPDNDVTNAVSKLLVKDNAQFWPGEVDVISSIGSGGGSGAAVVLPPIFIITEEVIGDPEPGVPKTFRLVYGYSKQFTCTDFQTVNAYVSSGDNLHVFRATYGSGNFN